MKQIIAVVFLSLFIIANSIISQEIIMKKNSEKDAIFKDEMKAKKALKDSLMMKLVNDADNYPIYKGSDLGLTYSKKKSIFKLWSPPAKSVKLNFYKKGHGLQLLEVNEMKKGKNGVWTYKAKGDKKGTYYTFQVDLGDSLLMETPDPYAKAVGVNGRRAMVVDLSETNPPGWENEQRPPLKSFSDIVLYEVHLRDISVDKNSGITHKGKFLGLAETGTKSPDGQSTGLDHIKDLGVTHIHLLPSYDFYSIDETRLEENRYNWGYDPQHYNVPEGSYSTDPYNGEVRIQEFKQMVKALHENGLRVVMDVVYNHTGPTWESVFNQTVPYYYYRTRGLEWSDAAACGNETASERYMYRMFMIESMKYWATEYHIDGFRVDLMGIHDIETMNQISAALHEIDPTIFIYGEGWTAKESTLPAEKRALKANAKKLKNISVFSDEFRDGVKGHVFTHNAKGFVSGEYDMEESVKFGIVGAIEHPQVNYEKINYSDAPWARQPTQCINYVSCHDNHTLWDRLQLSCSKGDEATWLKINKLAQTIVFTSQGVPFLHAGEEFVRTKNLVENSFESPDAVNKINWKNKDKYNDLFQYYKALIDLRKAHPAFRMGDAELVRHHLKFLDIKTDNIIGYVLNGSAVGDDWKRILVIFNGQKVGKNIEIPSGNWKMICHNYRIVPTGMGINTSKYATLMPYSAYILAEE